jgi:hypothetical protein
VKGLDTKCRRFEIILRCMPGEAEVMNLRI